MKLIKYIILIFLCLFTTVACVRVNKIVSGFVAEEAFQFPHPPDIDWVQPNSENLSIHHGTIVLNRGLSQCFSCHGSDLTGGTAKVSCGKCHPNFPFGHRILGNGIGDRDPDWANTTSIQASHHSQLFSTLTLEEKQIKVVKDCFRCHSVIGEQAGAPIGECFSCHHADSGVDKWKAMSNAQAQQWKEISPTNSYTNFHHRSMFLGSAGVVFDNQVTDCLDCHKTAPESLSNCMTCHHGQTSADITFFQTYIAYGENLHRMAKRINDTDGQYHATHHKHMFPTDFDSPQFQTVKATCLTCHPVTTGAEGDDLGFCITCHHRDPYYDSRIAINVNQDFFGGWMDAHLEMKENGMVDSVKGYRKTCLLCHEATDYNGDPVPRPPDLIQAAPITDTNCNDCHDLRADENFQIFLDD